MYYVIHDKLILLKRARFL